MMTTGPVAALACVTLKPQSLGEFGPRPQFSKRQHSPGYWATWWQCQETPKPPSLASQDTQPKLATNG